MEKRTISEQQGDAFAAYLQQEEHSRGTIEKYLRDVRRFSQWLKDCALTKEQVAAWKTHLLQEGYAAVTINSMLAAVRVFFQWKGLGQCPVKSLRIQRRIFRESSKELTREEYRQLLETAEQNGRERLALLLETICSTGIRVSEVPFITMEALNCGAAEIALKGKIRTILLPGKLCRKLKKYAKKQKINSGEIFLTRNGNSLSRKQIWAELKALCKMTDIEASKVFPHNLRHLFARVFYNASKDVAKLADVLGHSSIETTRIYLISTGREHKAQIEKLKLIN